MKKKLILILLSTISLFASKTFSQPGSLDLTFNKTGKVITDFQTHKAAYGNAIARQTDGKVVVAATYNGVFAVVRYNADGTLDNTFGVSGQVISNVKGEARSIAIQNDGKIIVAGTSSGLNADFITFRFNSNGSIDNSFGFSGIVRTDINGMDEQVTSMVIQQDGKIVIAGSSIYGLSYYKSIAVVRYNSNGTLDNTFSGDGKVITELEILYFDYGSGIANSVALQADGKIVVAGEFGLSIALVRYNSNGTIDNSFSSDGKVTVKTESGEVGDGVSASSVKIQPDGKIVAAGRSGTNFTVIRYNANGSVDNTFSTDGEVMIGFSGRASSGASLQIQDDGRLVLTGTSSSGTSFCCIARINPDGLLDPSFSFDGKVTTEITDNSLTIMSATMLPGSKIIVAGYSQFRYISLALIKYNTDGSLDNTFNSDGIVTTEMGIFNDQGKAVALQQDGKIIVAGYSFQGGKYRMALVRYKVNGILDSTFNSTGLLAKEYTSSFIATALKIQADRKIVAAGYLHNGANYDFALVRLKPDGIPDSTFSGDGLATTSFGSGNEYANSVAIQADGKIVVAGYVNNSTSDFAIARFNTNGSLDNLFSLDGKVTKDIAVNSYDHANSVAIQPDNKIIIAGNTYNGTNRDIALLRLHPDGSFDNTFSSDGIVTTDIYNQSIDIGACVVVQKDGKIVVGGTTNNGTDANFAIVRYSAGGVLDPTYSFDGKSTHNIDGVSNDVANAIAVQSDGKIILGGYSSRNSNQDFALLRLTSVGKLDDTFGNAGKVLTDFGSSLETAYALAVQQDGKIVLAGYSNNDFAIARYHSANTTGTLEAELAVLQGAVVSSSSAGFTGSGYADFVNASGDYIEWTANNMSAGSYALKFRYANGATTNRPLQLKINGTTVVASLAFAPTGGWTTWAFSSATASFNAGANKIRLTTIGSNGPNADHLALNIGSASQSIQNLVSEKIVLPAPPARLKAYIAPNPVTTGNAKLILSTSSDLPVNLQLIDMSGRSYKALMFSPGVSKMYDFSVNDLPPGIYNIILKQGISTTNTRLIVGSNH